MARLTKQPVANAATTRNLLQISLAAFAGVMLIALLATQATAQKRTQGRPASSRTASIFAR